jgi:hypothetical protein
VVGVIGFLRMEGSKYQRNFGFNKEQMVVKKNHLTEFVEYLKIEFMKISKSIKNIVTSKLFLCNVVVCVACLCAILSIPVIIKTEAATDATSTQISIKDTSNPLQIIYKQSTNINFPSFCFAIYSYGKDCTTFEILELRYETYGEIVDMVEEATYMVDKNEVVFCAGGWVIGEYHIKIRITIGGKSYIATANAR